MGERPEVSVGAAANAAEHSAMTVFQTALYTVQERLKTFQTSKFSWPFDSGPCTPKSLAEAGFYYCGTVQSPDWVCCIVCHENIDGWEENDDPIEEHKKCSPKCAYLKVKDPHNVTVAEVLDLEKAAIDYYVSAEASKLEADGTGYVEDVREEIEKLIEQREQSEND